jgi:AhpD family alkylhydroperoxidase
MSTLTKLLVAVLVLVLPAAARAQAKKAAPAPAAQAAYDDIQKTLGFVPGFFKAYPEEGIAGAWDEFKALQLGQTRLSGKDKELIGLAVSSQVPCKFCVYAHTQFAMLNGATEREVKEAVATAALVRKWSTVLNGMGTDDATFRKEIDELVARFKKGGTPPAPMAITDAASAMKDIQNQFGSVPAFFRSFPAAALPGAWKDFRDHLMSDKTALSGKLKELISIGVAAQVPCKYCVYADTQFARLYGATDAEIGEAVAMAALTRQWSTVLNGNAVDEAAFKRDVDRLVAGAKKQAAKTKPASAAR